jgi:Ca2+-binding RTX toxin-like protein
MTYVYADPVAVSEGAPFVDFVVRLEAASPNEVRVTFQTDVGTASHGSTTPDYQYRNETLVFAPGETSKTVRVTLLDGTVAEPTEVFWLDLYSAVNATILQRWTPALIFDNDGTSGTPALSVADVVVDETANTASFFVSLNRPSLSTVTVNYGTADDTARAGEDYTAASGTLSFAPGEMVKTVKVNLNNDTLAETDEFFKLMLANPANATLADATGAALIGRSDGETIGQPRFFTTPIVASEGDPYADFVVQLSAPSPNEVRVSFQTDAGTASHGTTTPDYQYRNETLVFAPGETSKTVRIALLDGTVAEPTEVFSLDLYSAVNASIADRYTTATILDNDGAGAVYSYGISNDVYRIASVLDRIAEGPRGGVDTVFASVSYALPEHVENIVLTGSANLNATGNAGNNAMHGNSGSNTLDGQDGIDTAAFAGPMASYAIAAGPNNSRTVSGAGGTDTLISIERLQFADVTRASDTRPGDNTYEAYAMFNAGFNRVPGMDELSLWTSTLDRLGGNTRDLAQAMINHYAPGVPNEALVAHLWSTIIGGAIPVDQLAFWTGQIVNGNYTQASILEVVAKLPENTNEIVGIVGQTLNLDPGYFLLPAG